MNIIYSARFFGVGAAFLLNAGSTALAQPSFQALPCCATAISADGRVVAGGGYRWTQETGLVELGSLPPPRDWATVACAASADGSVIVGYGLAELGLDYQAFRWTQDGGIVGIGDASSTWSIAWGVSGMGDVVVGEARTGRGIQAFRWTTPDIMIALGSLTGSRGTSVARGVSSNGSVIAGYSLNSDRNYEIFRWTAEKGMVGLGTLGFALAVSGDGTAIVGRAGPNGFPEAFRHTAETGLVGLGDLPGADNWSEAVAVSADGSIVVGESFTDLPGGGAFIWDETHGMRQLHAVLLDAGLDVAGWTLSVATGISADGRTIIGRGIDPENNYLPWLATLGGPCRADFNRDGVTNSQDFFDFLAAFFAHDPAADINNDGGVTTEDFFDFLEAFFAGCTR